jgi:hypothetical protein
VAAHAAVLTAAISCFVKLMRQFTDTAQPVANSTAIGWWSCTSRAALTLRTWLLRLSWFVAAGGPATSDPNAATSPDQHLQHAALFHLHWIRCHRRRIVGHIHWPGREWPVKSWS